MNCSTCKGRQISGTAVRRYVSSFSREISCLYQVRIVVWNCLERAYLTLPTRCIDSSPAILVNRLSNTRSGDGNRLKHVNPRFPAQETLCTNSRHYLPTNHKAQEDLKSWCLVFEQRRGDEEKDRQTQNDRQL